MAVILIDQFKGIAPAVSPVKLADGAAVECNNARFVATSIEPEPPSPIVDLVQPNVNSIYKWLDQYWLTSTQGETFVESPVANDVHKRIYAFGGDFPRYSAFATALQGYGETDTLPVWLYKQPNFPVNTFRLGVPAPNTAGVVFTPTVAVSGDADDDALEVTTSYVYTLVTQFGEEGPPSKPSSLVSYLEGQTRTVTIDVEAQGNYAFGAGALKRIYRTATGNTGTEFLFVDEVPYATSSYADTTADSQLGEVLPSANWFRPLDDDLSYAPDGPLQKTVLMPGGFLASFAGRTVCFSEPYLPHAWNPNNFLVTESNIVTIEDAPFGLIVLTETQPYVAVGVAPDAMGLSKLDVNQACVSAKSAANLGGQVIYSSPDGLVAIAGNQAQLATEGIITREQWRAIYNPTSIVGAVFENRYYGFYTDSSNQPKAFVYDPSNPDAPFVNISETATATHVSAKDDALYFVSTSTINGNLTLREYGTALNPSNTLRWVSKEYFLPVDTTFSWARVIADGDVEFYLYVDSAEVFTKVYVTNSEPFRLPANTRGRILQIKLLSQYRIDSVSIASERGEL